MTEFFEEMFDVADDLSSVSTDSTKALSNLVRQLENVVKDIDDVEAHLKRLKQEKHRLSTEAIPALMDEMDVSRLDVGEVTVALKPLSLHLFLQIAKRKHTSGFVITVLTTSLRTTLYCRSVVVKTTPQTKSCWTWRRRDFTLNQKPTFMQ